MGVAFLEDFAADPDLAMIPAREEMEADKVVWPVKVLKGMARALSMTVTGFNRSVVIDVLASAREEGELAKADSLREQAARGAMEEEASDARARRDALVNAAAHEGFLKRQAEEIENERVAKVAASEAAQAAAFKAAKDRTDAKKFERLVKERSDAWFAEWKSQRASESAVPTARGDAGVASPPAADKVRGKRKLVQVDLTEDGDDSVDDDSPSSGDSGTSSDSDVVETSPVRGRAKKSARRAAAAGPSRATKVSDVPATSMLAALPVQMNRNRLYREVMHMNPDDPKWNEMATYTMFMEEAKDLCRDMQRGDFRAIEPTAGDELLQALDTIHVASQTPYIRLSAMRAALHHSIPVHSESMKLQARATKQVAGYVKLASSELKRSQSMQAQARYPVPRGGAPPFVPPPRAPAPGDFAPGVGVDALRYARNGQLITCHACGQHGHYRDACPNPPPGGGQGRGRGGGRGGRGGGRQGALALGPAPQQ